MEKFLNEIKKLAPIVLLITITLGGIGVLTVYLTKFSDKGLNTIASVDEMDYTKYNGALSRGFSVISLINNGTLDQDGIVVFVQNGAGQQQAYGASPTSLSLDGTIPTNFTTTYSTLLSTVDKNYDTLTSKTATNYINQNASFKGVVMRDTNGSIAAMFFTQE